MEDIFKGELVRFTAEEPDALMAVEFEWQKDTEYFRYSSDYPAVLKSAKKIKAEFDLKTDGDLKPERFSFSVRTIDGDQLIGYLGGWISIYHSEAFVGLGIGDSKFWSKGYGTDMMRVCLRYLFLESNLARVSLGLFDYNPRALRSYEKAGFRVEGRTRLEVKREGRRYDSIWMGILREEWDELQKGKSP